MGRGKYKKCVICTKTFWAFPCQELVSPRRFCSQGCYHRDRVGKKMSKNGRINISFSKMAEKNPHWAGNRVGYTGLHRWVTKRMLKPELCVRCDKRKAYDLANKGIYDRNLENWEWLCRSCHMETDGRLERLRRNNEYYWECYWKNKDAKRTIFT